MKFNKLTIGLIAAGAVSLTAPVFADSALNDSSFGSTKDSGFYVRGQVGYDFLNDKGKTGAFKPAGSSNPLNPIVKPKSKSSLFNGRVGVGYNFNQFYAVEMGYSLISPFNYNFSGSQQVGAYKYAYSGSSKLSLSALDLIGKVTLPINNFFVFADGGAALVHAEYNKLALHAARTAAVPGIVTPAPLNYNFSSKRDVIRPVAGAGIGYNLTNNIAVDVSYNRIFGEGNKKSISPLPDVNQVLLGISYKF